MSSGVRARNDVKGGRLKEEIEEFVDVSEKPVKPLNVLFPSLF